VLVNVPEGIDLPQFEPGDEIALVVRIEPDGSFTLIRAENEDQPGDDDDGVDFDENELWAFGLLKALNDDYVAVKVEGRTELVKWAAPKNGGGRSRFTTPLLLARSVRSRSRTRAARAAQRV
jgi:hypothetical protein